MTDHDPMLEVLETPLGAHGAPEEHRQLTRRLYADDIETVTAHAAHGWDGWYPVCTLTLYGGENITIALDPTPDEAYSAALASDLAAAYQLYVPTESDSHSDRVHMSNLKRNQS